MFNNHTDLTMKSMFAGEYFPYLLPYKERIYLREQEENIDLKDMPDANNVYCYSFNDMQEYDYEYCECCGRKLTILDDDYKMRSFKRGYDLQTILCSNCKEQMSLIDNQELSVPFENDNIFVDAQTLYTYYSNFVIGD